MDVEQFEKPNRDVTAVSALPVLVLFCNVQYHCCKCPSHSRTRHHPAVWLISSGTGTRTGPMIVSFEEQGPRPSGPFFPLLAVWEEPMASLPHCFWSLLPSAGCVGGTLGLTAPLLLGRLLACRDEARLLRQAGRRWLHSTGKPRDASCMEAHCKYQRLPESTVCM